MLCLYMLILYSFFGMVLTVCLASLIRVAFEKYSKIAMIAVIEQGTGYPKAIGHSSKQ